VFDGVFCISRHEVGDKSELNGFTSFIELSTSSKEGWFSGILITRSELGLISFLITVFALTSLDDVDKSVKDINPFNSDLSPTSCREMQNVPLPQVIGGTNNTSLPTQLKIFPEKMFLQQTPSKEEILSLDEQNFGHLIGKKLIPRSDMRSPKVSSKDKGTWPNLLEQMMELYRNTLCPLMQMIDDNENAPLFRRKKVHKLLQTFFIKCQTLESSEKIGELDSRTTVILDHPCELKKFSVALADLMSRTTKDPYSIFANEEVEMLESFFKMCDEKESSEKLEELCQSILKRLSLDFDDQNVGSDMIMI
jgi:hypothetical protein